jgi:hypothetical protein
MMAGDQTCIAVNGQYIERREMVVDVDQCVYFAFAALAMGVPIKG